MQYLTKVGKRSRKRKPVAHLWNGEDTYCRMASTGGLGMGRYEVRDNLEGCRLCQLCELKHVQKRFFDRMDEP